MTTTSKFKIGDKVILESNNYALKTRVMSVCTIERITAVKKDIVLNNNYKFSKEHNLDKEKDDYER